MVAVAYERCSLTSGSKYSDLTWKLLVFWKTGRWGEVVAYERWSQPEVRLWLCYWPGKVYICVPRKLCHGIKQLSRHSLEYFFVKEFGIKNKQTNGRLFSKTQHIKIKSLYPFVIFWKLKLLLVCNSMHILSCQDKALNVRHVFF